MIVIKDAIASGEWHRIELPNTRYSFHHMDRGDLVFELRATDFFKVDLSTVDSLQNLETPLTIQSNVWLLRLDVVNLFKRKVEFNDIFRRLTLTDNSSGKKYRRLTDMCLCYFSNFANDSGTRDFHLGVTMPPKIKRTGALLYDLHEGSDNLILSVSRF